MQRYNIKPVLSISIDSLVQIAKYYGMGTEHSLGTLPRYSISEGIEAVFSVKLTRVMMFCSPYWRTVYLGISLL